MKGPVKGPKQLGPYPAANGDRRQQFEWTGEWRRPKQGEWYLSGAEVQAWYALGDLETEYHIAQPVAAPEEIEAYGYVYKRAGQARKGE